MNSFMLFGMGPSRRKLVYVSGGKLRDAITLEVLHEWQIDNELFDPVTYSVRLQLVNGGEVCLREDEDGVWLEEGGSRRCLTCGQRISLPEFSGKYAPYLRILHAELLVNIMPFGPVPNLWVYPRPWFRDAAMMLMCFAQTGNLHLVESWVMGLHDVSDRNNGGHIEPDNLGQILYMFSLYGRTDHPLINRVLHTIDEFKKDDYVVGLTDGAEHPVYQTKWLKYGMRSLEFDDSAFRIPQLQDSYSSLFWMDYRDQHVPGPRFGEKQLELYPYLNWAESHFYQDEFPEPLGCPTCALTREGEASQAEHWRLDELAEAGAISQQDVANRISRPHTWHAAEIFLYLLELSSCNVLNG